MHVTGKKNNPDLSRDKMCTVLYMKFVNKITINLNNASLIYRL